MKFLLDTHIWLWWLEDDDRLSGPVVDALSAPDARVYLSSVSAWEIAIKSQLRKLPLPEPAAVFVRSRVESSGVIMLEMTFEHALSVEGLSPHHRDPFDRLLVAQAQVEGMRLVTADAKLAAYGIDLLLVN